jgi:hypothetical protein
MVAQAWFRLILQRRQPRPLIDHQKHRGKQKQASRLTAQASRLCPSPTAKVKTAANSKVFENDLKCPDRVDLFVASLMKNAEVKHVTRL